ncbi:hypothetical protein SPADD19_01352 [Streptococcus parasanguinis]|nr:hypothetical protein SPADD19_01352 [Streptococcus parasanguinis]
MATGKELSIFYHYHSKTQKEETGIMENSASISPIRRKKCLTFYLTIPDTPILLNQSFMKKI